MLENIRPNEFCPIINKKLRVTPSPCNDCAFFDVDVRKCRIIRTDETLQIILDMIQNARG